MTLWHDIFLVLRLLQYRMQYVNFLDFSINGVHFHGIFDSGGCYDYLSKYMVFGSTLNLGQSRYRLCIGRKLLAELPFLSILSSFEHLAFRSSDLLSILVMSRMS